MYLFDLDTENILILMSGWLVFFASIYAVKLSIKLLTRRI